MAQEGSRRGGGDGIVSELSPGQELPSITHPRNRTAHPAATLGGAGAPSFQGSPPPGPTPSHHCTCFIPGRKWKTHSFHPSNGQVSTSIPG